MTASTPTSRRSAPFSYIVGMPPPPAQMTTRLWSSSQPIAWISKIRFGRGEGTTRRQYVAVGLDGPALVGGEGLRLGLVVDRPDELRRVAEGRVVGVDLDHRQDRRERQLERQQVAELLLDEVADHPLRLGAEHVEGIGLDVLVGLALERQQPDLRAVAVGDDQLVLARRRSRAPGPRSRTLAR